MKIISNKSLAASGLSKLKHQDWLEKQRVAGKVVAGTLMLLENLVKEKSNLSLLEMNNLAEQYITDHNCIPTFKHYRSSMAPSPFPSGVCMSVNKQLVHGIPTDYKLQDGDVIKFDLGATYQGAIADSALTCIYGSPKTPGHVKMITACYESLMKGITAIKVGSHLGVIGNAINKSAKGNAFNVITTYGGHGLDWDKPHSQPFVANKCNIDEGIRIQPGLAIAIEPMLVPYDTSTIIAKDGWTVLTNEIGAHFEHSVFVHEDYVEILTKRDSDV